MCVSGNPTTGLWRFIGCQTVTGFMRAWSNQTAKQKQRGIAFCYLFPPLFRAFGNFLCTWTAPISRTGSDQQVNVLGFEPVHEIVVPFMTIIIAWFTRCPREVTSRFDGQDNFPVMLSS